MGLSSRPPITLASILLLLPSLVTAYTIDCEDIRVEKTAFNFNQLGGPHVLYQIDDHPPSYSNITFTLDVCARLTKAEGAKENEKCPGGSRVCAIERLYNPIEDKEPETLRIVPIAGEFSTSIGGALDPHWKLLTSSDSPPDREKEGLRLTMNGGKYTENHKTVKQKAVVNFYCLPDGKTDETLRRRDEILAADDDDDDGGDRSGEEVDDEHGGRIKLISWDMVEDIRVLSLEWHTKYACADAKDPEGGSSSGHWGFFTWFIIIIFLGIAAYLIFGSWLSYSRYSARGWDLLPHSETIRDIPYLFRDWMRSIINTVQGGGSRGGYSAV